jgi:EmrB/QacA subfamily drug resistance transporter
MTDRRASRHLTFAVLAAGVMAFALLQSLVIPVLPTIQEALGASQADVTWVLTAYLLSASIFTPIVGRLGDMTGKKRMFVVALGALAVGCLLAALASSLAVMIVARVIQGIGGGVLPLAFGIVRDEFPEDKVPGAVSVVASLAAAGAGVGLVLAGPIVELLGHDWLFWFPLVVLVVAATAAHFVVPESRVTTAGRVNWVAALLLSGWLVALLLPISQAPAWGWGSPAVLVLLAVAVVLAVLWVVVESRARYPLIDMRMMRLRAVWTTNLVALLIGVAMYASFAFLPQFLQTPPSAGYGFGATVTESGLLILPQTAASFLLGLVCGRLGQRFGSKNVLVVGSVLAAIGYFLFAVAHSHPLEVSLIATLMGIGFGLSFASMSNLIVAAVPQEQTGVASGMNANIRTIGGSLGSAVMASVVTAHPGADGLPAESGYTTGFLLLAGALVLSALAALLIPAVRRDPVTHQEPEVALRHPEAALVAGGTLVGDEPE